MNNTLIANKYIHEANICKLLSLLYCQPNEDITDIFIWLEQEIGYCCPEKLDIVSEMKISLEQNTLEEIKIAHAKLFLGPFDLISPPYSSVYLDGGRRIMGDSTMEALNYYRRAELNPDSNFKEPPDHITTELEFLYYLTFKYLNTEDSRWLELRREFTDKHLNGWISSFTKKVKDSNTIFYKDLALLTEEIPNILN